MDFVPYRVLRNTPGELRRRLKEHGYLVVTSDGEPFAVMIEIRPKELEQTLHILMRLRAQEAVQKMRAIAQERGLAKLSEEEITEEIRATRSER